MKPLEEQIAEVGIKVYFLDHCQSFSKGTVIGKTKEELAIKSQDRIVIKKLNECFSSEHLAISYRLRQVEKELNCKQAEWSRLAVRLTELLTEETR